MESAAGEEERDDDGLVQLPVLGVRRSDSQGKTGAELERVRDADVNESTTS